MNFKNMALLGIFGSFILGSLAFIYQETAANTDKSLKKELLKEDKKIEQKNLQKIQQIETTTKSVNEQKSNSPVKVNYQKLLKKDKEIKKQQTKLIKMFQENSIEPSTNNIEYNQIGNKIYAGLIKWYLLGSHHNILVIDYSLKNNNEHEINSKMNIYCYTLDKNGNKLESINNMSDIFVSSNTNHSFVGEIIGKIQNPKFDSIECQFKLKIKKEIQQKNIVSKISNAKEIKQMDNKDEQKSINIKTQQDVNTKVNNVKKINSEDEKLIKDPNILNALGM